MGEPEGTGKKKGKGKEILWDAEKARLEKYVNKVNKPLGSI